MSVDEAITQPAGDMTKDHPFFQAPLAAKEYYYIHMWKL